MHRVPNMVCVLDRYIRTYQGKQIVVVLFLYGDMNNHYELAMLHQKECGYGSFYYTQYNPEGFSIPEKCIVPLSKSEVDLYKITG